MFYDLILNVTKHRLWPPMQRFAEMLGSTRLFGRFLAGQMRHDAPRHAMFRLPPNAPSWPVAASSQNCRATKAKHSECRAALPQSI